MASITARQQTCIQSSGTHHMSFYVLTRHAACLFLAAGGCWNRTCALPVLCTVNWYGLLPTTMRPGHACSVAVRWYYWVKPNRHNLITQDLQSTAGGRTNGRGPVFLRSWLVSGRVGLALKTPRPSLLVATHRCHALVARVD